MPDLLLLNVMFSRVVYYRALWHTFKPKLEKIKKIHPKNFLAPKLKNFLYFRKSNFLAPRLKNVLYFWKWSFLASYWSYISGRNFASSKNRKNRSEKMSHFWGNGTS